MTRRTNDAVDPDFVVRLRIVLSRLARQLNSTAGAEGMSATQAAIFTAVGRRGPIGLGRLAEAENVNPSMLSRTVGKLEGSGLVERSADPNDGRAYTIRQTAAGQVVHARMKEEKTKWLVDRLKYLEPERIEQLLAALPALEDLTAALLESEQVRPV